MKLQVDFGEAQTGYGYQFYSASGLIGSRVTTGITNPRTGVYAATDTPGAGTVGIYWDCDNPDFTSIEDLSERITLETNLNATVSSRSSHSAADVWSVGTRTLTSFGTLIADIWTYVTRTLTAGGGASVDDIAARMITDHGAGSYVAVGGGSGAYLVTVTVKDEGDDPLENATVRLSEGINAFTATSNSSGVATFNLDAATYSIGVSKDGYQFTPTTIVVTAPANFDEQMAQIVIPAPADPSQCACYLTTRDGNGAAEAAVKITFILKSAPTPDSYDIGMFDATSDTNGSLIVNLRRGASYTAQRGRNIKKPKPVPFTVPDQDVFQLPQVLGDP